MCSNRLFDLWTTRSRTKAPFVIVIVSKEFNASPSNTPIIKSTHVPVRSSIAPTDHLPLTSSKSAFLAIFVSCTQHRQSHLLKVLVCLISRFRWRYRCYSIRFLTMNPEFPGDSFTSCLTTLYKLDCNGLYIKVRWVVLELILIMTWWHWFDTWWISRSQNTSWRVELDLYGCQGEYCIECVTKCNIVKSTSTGLACC